MSSTLNEEVPIIAETDIVRVRHAVRRFATTLGFSIVEQTKMVTAASELARNTLIYGKGGAMRVEVLTEERRRGLKLAFEDRGPGIADIAQALTDGFTSGGGLGLGLGGAKRLVDDFRIRSEVGQGTCIEVTRWKAL